MSFQFHNKRKLIRLITVVILVIVGWFTKDNLDPDRSAKQSQDDSTKTTKDYVVHLNGELAPSKYNDGDSFLIRHGTKTQEYRLYYVDTPESRDKPYDDHKRRVMQQARALGLADYKETLEIGKMAKVFTSDLLAAGHFKIYTTGELVYNGPRQYAFVKVSYNGERMWLHELLIKKGLARIHTLGRELPDGTPYFAQKKRLQQIEETARDQRIGAWASSQKD